MSAVITYRDQVIADIRRTLPDLRRVEPHAGNFDEAEVKRLILDAPCVMVAAIETGKRQLQNDGTVIADIGHVAFVVVRDTPRLAADKAGWTIAEAIFALVNMKAYQGAWPAKDAAIENLYTQKADKNGYQLMAVSWLAPIQIGRSFHPEDRLRDLGVANADFVVPAVTYIDPFDAPESLTPPDYPFPERQ